MKLLEELAHAGASPGFEQEIRSIIMREIQDHVDELRLSRLGSVVATKRADVEVMGETPLKILILGGMSQIGFAVKRVDSSGFLHLTPMGEWCPQQYIGKHVLVKTHDSSLQGVILPSPLHLHEVLVDMGLPEVDVLKHVKIGSLVGLNPDFSEDNELITGQTLENIAGIYTLIQVIKTIKKENLKSHFSVVFSNQEHLKTRKHMQEHYSLSPDLSLTLDCMKVYQPHHKLGGGPIIGSRSSAEPAHPLVINTLRRVAAKYEIPHQMSHHPEPEVEKMHQNLIDFGHYMGGVSIPVEAKEPLGLRASKRDLLLTCALLENISSHHDFGDFER
jgi:endoglucanase